MTRRSGTLVLAVLVLFLALAVPFSSHAGSQLHGIFFDDHGTLSANEFGSHPLLSGAFVRSNWSLANPSPGVFDFSDLEYRIAAWAAYGKTVYVGLIPMGQIDPATPEWIYTKGVTKICYERGTKGTTCVPKIWDEASGAIDADYSAYYSALVRAFAQKYGNDPRIAAVMVSIGHLGYMTANPNSEGRNAFYANGWTVAIYQNLVRDIVALYKREFPNKPLVVHPTAHVLRDPTPPAPHAPNYADVNMALAKEFARSGISLLVNGLDESEAEYLASGLPQLLGELAGLTASGNHQQGIGDDWPMFGSSGPDARDEAAFDRMMQYAIGGVGAIPASKISFVKFLAEELRASFPGNPNFNQAVYDSARRMLDRLVMGTPPPPPPAPAPSGTPPPPPPPSPTSDTTTPTVSFTSPATGATVSGSSVSVSATASDNVGVVGVQVKVDGVNLGPEGAGNNYSTTWDTRTTSNGSHTVTAVARDAAGNTKSSSVTVTVANAAITPSSTDTTAPIVAVNTPGSGATVSGTSVTLSATASDTVGVAGVQFKVDGVNVGAEDTTAPYSMVWSSKTVANGTHTITAVARDRAGNTKTSAPVAITVSNAVSAPTPQPPPADGSIRVWKVSSNGAARQVSRLLAFGPALAGVISVATGDIDGDGVAEVITGEGDDGSSGVRVWRVNAQGSVSEVASFFAYDPALSLRVYVAAGDVDGDGKAEIITGTGNHGSPHVRVWKVGAGGTVSEVASFYAYDPAYRRGVSVAAGDVDGDGKSEIITGSGPDGGSHVRVWKVSTGGTVREMAGFSAYGASYTRRVFVAAGDVDGDGKAEIITGAGNSEISRVRVWKVGASGRVSEVASFYANDPAYRGGVSVAAGDVDGDGKSEIVTGTGPNGGSHVRVWKVGAGGAVSEVTSFSAYDSSYRGRAFIAAGKIDGDEVAEIVTGAAAVTGD